MSVPNTNSSVSKTEQTLRRVARERILVLDGAMGTMIQELKLDEEGYRGARFDAWNREVRGNNDLLILTQPDAIRDIHLAYFRAGADIVSTNTFSSTAIAQADYGMQDIAYELNLEGARLARAAADIAQARTAARASSPARSGPTNRTASISPDVSNPGFRAITFDQLRAAYGEQVKGLIDGGADLLLIETIFDTLNAKAAIYAIAEAIEARGMRAAGDDLRHHHRPLRAAPLRPDAGRVLEFGAARRAVLDRAQLRARRQGDARAYRRDRARRRYARLRLSERRPAQRVRPLRREPRIHGASCSASSRPPASSTSSAAAAAPRRTISARSRARSKARRRGRCPRCRGCCASPASRPSRSRRKSRS